jgi:hypothetical protein
VLGKEKPLGLALTTRQSSLLLGLAAHGRGFEFATIPERVSFHPYGWIDVSNNQLLQVGLLELAAVCKGTDVCIESYKDKLFRLSINPEMVYFDEKLFTFSVKLLDLSSVQTKIPADISRAEFETAFGTVRGKTEKFRITLEFANKLKLLATQAFSADNEIAVKIEDTYKKGLHKEDNFLLLGLRSLIRQEAGIVKFNLPYTIV